MTHELKKRLFTVALRWFITISIVIIFTTLLLLLTDTPPLEAYFLLIKGSLGSWNKIARVLQVWIPLTLCSCGLLYTFSMRLWNIGIEGQVMLGAIGATAMLKWLSPYFAPSLCLTAAFVFAIFLGTLWSLFAGILKTEGGVNEIFAGLGLNFVAQGLILWLIFGPWKRPGIASMSGTEPFDYSLWLPTLHGFRISPLALAITIILFIATVIIHRYTRWGLFFRAVGNNPNAGTLFGLSPQRYTLLAMSLAGVMAGCAGYFQVTGIYHRLIPSISSNYGYLSLLVVMLANYKWMPIPFIAFFFACLNVGSIQLPLMLKIDSSLSGVIQGICVLAFLCAYRWKLRSKG